MKFPTVLLSCLLLSAVMAGDSGDKAVLSSEGKASVTLPKGTVPGQQLVLRVAVGALPQRARIVVRSEAGEILGSVSPFPPSAGKEEASYTIPVPEKLTSTAAVGLVFTLEAAGANPRPATATEVKELTILRQP